MDEVVNYYVDGNGVLFSDEIELLFSDEIEPLDVVGRGLQFVFDTRDITEVFRLPECVKEIASEVYIHSDKMKKIYIPATLKKIEWDARIGEPYVLESVIFAKNSPLTLIPYCFRRIISLKEVILPDHLQEIGDNAFEGCSSLEEIIIPDGVKKIGYGAFDNCTSLKEIALPDSVTELGDDAFRGCTNLKTVYTNNLCSIGSGAFFGTKMRNFVLPPSVRSIGCKFPLETESLVIPERPVVEGWDLAKDCRNWDESEWPVSMGWEFAKNVKNLYILAPQIYNYDDRVFWGGYLYEDPLNSHKSMKPTNCYISPELDAYLATNTMYYMYITEFPNLMYLHTIPLQDLKNMVRNIPSDIKPYKKEPAKAVSNMSGAGGSSGNDAILASILKFQDMILKDPDHADRYLGLIERLSQKLD